ncbi:MAG: outer membrane beta-barrel protein [Maioricimonas sp. JB045]
MVKLTMRTWLLMAGAAAFLTSPAIAAGPAACRPVAKAAATRTVEAAPKRTVSAEPKTVLNAEHVFGNAGAPLVRPVGYNSVCAPSECAPADCAPAECAPFGCDDVTCDGYGCGDDSCGFFGRDMDDPWTLQGATGIESVNFGGWTQFGYTNKSTGQFNSSPNRLNLHQQWFYLEKEADGSEGLDWGFRADLMYGIDADDTQAFGNHPGRYDYLNGWDHGQYGWALPQLYGEVAYKDVSIIAGHFYTLLGYEVVTAPDNFFYSHAFTMYNSEAFTHTGVLATYAASDNVELYGGWTLGWDTGFDQLDGGSNFLGGASVSLLDDVTVTYILTVGDLGLIGDGYTHSIVADVALTDKLNYVLQSDLVSTTNPVGTATGTNYDTIGVNQYLIYTVNDHLGVGSRFEWWKSDGTSYYEMTYGVNVKPHANLVIRPEVRYQWAPAAQGPNAKNPAGLPVYGGVIFGIDTILTF